MWSFRRQFIYALAVLLTIASVTVFFLRDTIFPPPTCFDKKANGYESGVDCGGECSLICKGDVNPLSVVWTKAIPTSSTTYDLVALVSNTNINNAANEMGYTFSLYDTKGSLIGAITGSTTAPLDGKFPIIVQNIPLATPPSNVVVTLSEGPHYTVKENPTSPTLKILERRYEAGSISRIYATLGNTKRLVINDLPVRVVLFDDKDNAYAVGQTIVPVLQKEEVKEISFTWNPPLLFPPTRIGIYPIFDPFKALGE